VLVSVLSEVVDWQKLEEDCCARDGGTTKEETSGSRYARIKTNVDFMTVKTIRTCAQVVVVLCAKTTRDGS
jgi:hypothetical protein